MASAETSAASAPDANEVAAFSSLADMKYLALLRGVNVGGRNLVRMAALRACLEQEGLEHVTTFIQSGNVIFESRNKHEGRLTTAIERRFSRTFGYESSIVLRSAAQMRDVLAHVPPEWKRRTDLRCNIAFLKEPVRAREALKEIEVQEGVDSVTAGKGVVYMTTPLSQLGRSRFPKVVGKKIYRSMTIRNYNTCRKLLALMEQG